MVVTTSLFLIFVAAVNSLEYSQEIQFLKDQGLEHLIEKFRSEEITINLFPFLSDDNLKELGILTIGARIRFRQSAQTWIDKPLNAVTDSAVTDSESPSESVINVTVIETLPENSQEQESEVGLIFFKKTLSTGRITHHFLDQFYRFDRNKVHKNGRTHFSCSVKQCKAR